MDLPFAGPSFARNRARGTLEASIRLRLATINEIVSNEMKFDSKDGIRAKFDADQSDEGGDPLFE